MPNIRKHNFAVSDLLWLLSETNCPDFDLIERSRCIVSLWRMLEFENTPEFMILVGIDSQTDHLPKGNVRTHWNTNALAAADAESAKYEIELMTEFQHACRELVAYVSARVKWRVRPARPADLPHLPAIERDAAQIYRTIGFDFCADGPVRDQSAHLRGLDTGALFVAEAEDERIVGFVLLWPVDGCAHIAEISVARACQGQGIGAALMARAEDWARLRDYREITLTTFRDVPWNAPYYERLGYAAFTPGPERTELAAIQAEEAGFGFAARPRIAMRKSLCPSRPEAP